MQSKIERIVQGQLDASSTPCLHESIHKLQRIFFRLTGSLKIKNKISKHNISMNHHEMFFYRYLQGNIIWAPNLLVTNRNNFGHHESI